SVRKRLQGTISSPEFRHCGVGIALKLKIHQTVQIIEDSLTEIIGLNLAIIEIDRLQLDRPFHLSLWQQPANEMLWVLSQEPFGTGIPFSRHTRLSPYIKCNIA